MTKVPAEIWKSTIAKYRKKCQTILELSENIRYVGVINLYGRTMSGIVRTGVKPLLNTEEAKNEFFIIPTLMNLRKDVSNALGELEYVLLYHKKTPIIILQREKITYYISLNKLEQDGFNHIELIDKIKNIIKTE